MDPVTMYLISAGIPMLAGAMTDRPGMPSYNMPVMPDRSKYLNQILSTGFNPQSEIHRLAADRASQDVARALGRMGYGGGSSVGRSMISSSAADLANKFLENELQRQTTAMGTVGQYDLGRANIEAGLAQQQYQAMMNQYGQDLAAQQGGIAGFGKFMGGLGSTYAQQQQVADANKRADLQREMFESRYGPLPSTIRAAQPIYTGDVFNVEPGRS